MNSGVRDALIASFNRGRAETQLVTLLKVDQEVAVRLIKIFPTKAGPFGPKSSIKVVN